MKIHCLSCRRQRRANKFHYIPNPSGTNRTFIWCEKCNASLSITEKKKLVWYLCTRSQNEADALDNLERARHLCTQIDKGL